MEILAEQVTKLKAEDLIYQEELTLKRDLLSKLGSGLTETPPSPESSHDTIKQIQNQLTATELAEKRRELEIVQSEVTQLRKNRDTFLVAQLGAQIHSFSQEILATAKDQLNS